MSTARGLDALSQRKGSEECPTQCKAAAASAGERHAVLGDAPAKDRGIVGFNLANASATA